MKVRFWAVLICVSASGAAMAQTSREYFNELRDANAFTHYGDEYVCFHDDDTGGFAVVSTSKSIEKRMAENSKIGAKPKPLREEILVVTTYFKGGANATQLYEKMDKDSDERWGLEFKSPPPLLHGKIVYMFNWATGRYRLQVFALDHSKTVPASENSGKCELIHPAM